MREYKPNSQPWVRLNDVTRSIKNATGLLPCPFCGKHPELIFIPKDKRFEREYIIGNVRCCLAHITVRGKQRKKILEQIQLQWNARVTLP